MKNKDDENDKDLMEEPVADEISDYLISNFDEIYSKLEEFSKSPINYEEKIITVGEKKFRFAFDEALDGGDFIFKAGHPDNVNALKIYILRVPKIYPKEPPRMSK